MICEFLTISLCDRRSVGLGYRVEASHVVHCVANFIAINMVLGHHSSLQPKVTTLEWSDRGYSRSEASQFIVAEVHSFLKIHYPRYINLHHRVTTLATTLHWEGRGLVMLADPNKT